ncbi:hypothetical protein [Streptomyces sp. B93]|uniref:hypothetical protein n=1 Tax=Streptomyces sp. B93 TaxID=2824875 RepID=UPI001B39C109|nr:hypothetical protein [Streptomyces sp. B93]MBQ1088356.1 hypothetical protein [Streptomyces sp. B93]
MIESHLPDFAASSLRSVLDSDQSAVRQGLEWIGSHADQERPIAAGGEEGGGAERID